MLNFTYNNPTKILFGKGCIKEIRDEIPEESKVLIIYGGGSVKDNGTLEQVIDALVGYDTLEFSGIEPNPTYETLMECVEVVKTEDVDFLLAVGGGSVIDGTKFIAAASLYDGEPWDFLENHGASVEAALPIGTVLTLPATGSEMNANSVISRRELSAKLHFGSPHVYPQFSALDPATTFSLPANQTANGIVDAFVHIAEQYLTYPVNAKVQDRLAEGLLLTLIEEGPKVLEHHDDYDARANVMWCATMALNGIIGVGVPQDWSTHMVGHELTALHGLDHAQTLAIVLPNMLRLRKQDKHLKLLQYAERVWGLHDGDEDELINQAIDKTEEFFESLGVSTKLSHYHVTERDTHDITKQLWEHGFSELGEHADVTPEMVAKILRMSL